MFTNLLTNAFEALDGQGHIAITAAAERDRRGSGVRRRRSRRRRPSSSTSPTTARACRRTLTDRIFDPFFTTKPQGSGLGLAIVRKIVDAHDGRIDVEQRAGHGHAVPRHAAGVERVELVQEWHGRSRQQRTRRSWAEFSSLTITTRSAAGWRAALTEAGHEVEEASNGNAAIERLHDSYFDVVSAT